MEARSSLIAVAAVLLLAAAPSAQNQVEHPESLSGAIVVDASKFRVVVSVDVADVSGIVDGIVDRVFVVQREEGRSLQLSGMGQVTYGRTRLTVRLNDGTGPLVFRIVDRDQESGLDAGGEVASVIGIASMTPGTAMTFSQQSLDALRVVPDSAPSCSSCWSGGAGATSCSISCGGNSCSVTCSGDYSACCNCTGAPQCICCM